MCTCLKVQLHWVKVNTKVIFSLIGQCEHCIRFFMNPSESDVAFAFSRSNRYKRSLTNTVLSWVCGLPRSTVRLVKTQNQDLARNKEQIHSQYSWCFHSTIVPRLEMDYLIVMLISYWKTTLRIHSFQYVSMYGKIWRVMTFSHSKPIWCMDQFCTWPQHTYVHKQTRKHSCWMPTARIHASQLTSLNIYGGSMYKDV